MSIFSEYRPHDGVFTSFYVTGQCPDNTADSAWIEGAFDHTKQRIDVIAALVVDYTPPPPTLYALQADKWTAIKASRDAAINSPLVTPHGTFDSDPASRANIGGAVALAQTLAAATPPFVITYTLADNTSVVLDGPSMVGVGLALGAKVQAAFATARALRVRIDAATSPADLDAITWAAP